jgi:hypothetical protein
MLLFRAAASRGGKDHTDGLPQQRNGGEHHE